VCIYFGGRLLRGNRAVKVDAGGLGAFASPNFPALGTAGVEIQIHWNHVLPPQPGEFTVQEFGEAHVAALRIFPGIRAAVVANMVQPPLEGLVLEAYGVGNAPDRDQELLDVLAAATARGVVVVCCTQCLRGTVDLSDYATGAGLARAGVISGRDMTAEAALAKLSYLFSLGLSPTEVRRKMQENLRGEMGDALVPARPWD
jgi:L-asparaginase